MAGRRKAEIQLQMQVESQEEWEELMSKEGLNVIDVYQEWCGPCRGMLSNFKKMKNEVGDPLLKFVTAKADTIDALEKYRGHCEPCFLFYAGGCLVGVVRGANSPKILRTITEQLKQEHKVMDGSSERKEIKDPFIAELEAKEKEADKQDEEEEEEGVKEVTIALIKPDAVEAGKVDQILEDIKAHGIEVLRHEERNMTEDEVREFYSHLQDSDFFEDLVKFMTSGPSHILALTKGKTGENIIDEFRDLIGPTDVEEAKTQKPESLRAKHGQQNFMNALHGSSSAEMATRELAFFFPDFVAPAVEGKPKLQRTLALVRPEAFKQHKDAILEKIRESGFKVAMQKEMHLTREMAEEFYKEHEGQDYFEQLVTNMSSGPVFALGLAREDAIEGWRNMLGPKEVPKAKEEAPESLRAKFAVDDAINSLHGSDSEETAKKELQFFFPMEQTVAVIKPDAEGTKDEIVDRIHEAGFRIAARKETTLSRDVAEEFYADHKDKDYYNELVDHMTSGPTYLMVLSREAAVDGWRSMIGPTDPAQAKEVAPDSLRATYGENILKNAVHGSSNPDHAKKTIQAIFDTIDEEPEKEEGEKPQSDSTKEAEESSPEFKQQEEEQNEEEKSKEEPKEEKQEEQQQQEPSDEQSPTEETKTEQQTEEEPKTEETKTEQQSEEEPKTEETKTEQQSEEEPKTEETKTEQQSEEEPKTEETKTEQQSEEEPKTEETKTEQQSEEEPKTEETKTEQQSEEEPKTEETKTEQQTEEEPKTEETKTEQQSEEEPKTDTKTDTKSEGENQQDTKKDENADTETQQDNKADTTSETDTKKASTEESKQDTTEEQPKEDSKQEVNTQQASTEESKQDTTEEQQKEDSKQEVNTQQEQKEEAPKEPEKTEEKAPSPKPSETETKPSETEAQQSETEAKPSETEAQPSETDAKPEEQKEGETEQKTEDTTQGDEEKKEESQTEEKTPEAQNTTEESKDEKKEEETKQEGAD